MKINAIIASVVVVFCTINGSYGAPIYFAAAIPSIVVVNSLATTLALLGITKLGVAATAGKLLGGGDDSTSSGYTTVSSGYSPRSARQQIRV
jgi:hypothetical protein